MCQETVLHTRTTRNYTKLYYIRLTPRLLRYVRFFLVKAAVGPRRVRAGVNIEERRCMREDKGDLAVRLLL